MADKNSTMVLKVNLKCAKCHKKIRSTLYKFDEDIVSQKYDFKKNTVTISGPFNPRTLKKKLKLEAKKVIKKIDIEGDDDKKEEKKKSMTETKPEKKDEPKKSEPVLGIVKVVEPGGPFLAHPMPQPYVVYPGPVYDRNYGGIPYYGSYGGSKSYGQGFAYYKEETSSCNIM